MLVAQHMATSQALGDNVITKAFQNKRGDITVSFQQPPPDHVTISIPARLTFLYWQHAHYITQQAHQYIVASAHHSIKRCYQILKHTIYAQVSDRHLICLYQGMCFNLTHL
jgi:hypothetical protein